MWIGVQAMKCYQHNAQHLLDLPELIAVAENKVHMLVESFEGSNKDAAILQNAAHPVVNVLQHLAAFSHRLQEIQKNLQLYSVSLPYHL